NLDDDAAYIARVVGLRAQLCRRANVVAELVLPVDVEARLVANRVLVGDRMEMRKVAKLERRLKADRIEVERICHRSCVRRACARSSERDRNERGRKTPATEIGDRYRFRAAKPV